MAVNIDRHGDGMAPKLLLHVRGRIVFHEQDGRIGMTIMPSSA